MDRQYINILKKMRADLAQQIAALDAVLSLLEYQNGSQTAEEPIPDLYTEASEFTTGLAGHTKFESAIDISKLRDEPEGPWTCPKCGALNPVGAKSCSECKTPKDGTTAPKKTTKRSRGIRSDT